MQCEFEDWETDEQKKPILWGDARVLEIKRAPSTFPGIPRYLPVVLFLHPSG